MLWQGGGFRGCLAPWKRPRSQPRRASGPSGACHHHAGAAVPLHSLTRFKCVISCAISAFHLGISHLVPYCWLRQGVRASDLYLSRDQQRWREQAQNREKDRDRGRGRDSGRDGGDSRGRRDAPSAQATTPAAPQVGQATGVQECAIATNKDVDGLQLASQFQPPNTPIGVTLHELAAPQVCHTSCRGWTDACTA